MSSRQIHTSILLSAALLMSGLLLGCEPRGIDNPAGSAETVTESTLASEYMEANEKDCRDLEVKEAKKKLKAIDHFIGRYEKPIRIRYKNGNLKFGTADQDLLGKIRKQRDICIRFIEDKDR